MPVHINAQPPNEDETKQSQRKNAEGPKPPYVEHPHLVPPQATINTYPTRKQPPPQNQIPIQQPPLSTQSQPHLVAATIQNRPPDTLKRVSSPHVPRSPQVTPSQPPPPHNQHSASPFQPSVLPAHFNQPAGRNAQPKPPAAAVPNVQSKPQPSSQNANKIQIQQHMYTHHQPQGQQQHNASAAVPKSRLNPGGGQNGINGRSTPQPPHPPLPRNMNPSPNPSRGSPLVSSKTPSRSPMTPNAQAIPQQMNHPPQHLTFQNHYPPHVRPIMHTNGSSHPPLPAHLVNNAGHSAPSPGPTTQQQVSSQDQGHPPPMYAPHMLNYPMGMAYPMQPGRMPQGYGWGIGRGIPGVVNGQHIPGVASNNGHPQMPLGKAVPGGVQR
jgi:hypothetical protein